MAKYYKVFILILFALVQYQSTVAQKGKWVPGLIVKEANHDTVRGLIRYYGTDVVKRGKEVTFKKGSDDTPRKYSPADLSSYQLKKNLHYISYTLRKSETALDTTQKVFLRTLVEGAADLYSYYPEYGNPHFYIIDARNIFWALNKTAKKVTYSDRTLGKTTKRYVGILHLAFYDCPTLEIDEGRVELERKPLIKAVISYNKCKDPNYKRKFLTDKSAIEVEWGIKAGVGSHSLIHNYFVVEENATKSYTRYSPYIGAYSELTFLGFNPQFSLRLELAYEKKGNTSGKKLWFELPYMSFSVWPKYEFMESDATPYLGAGVTGGYLLNKNDTPYRTRKGDHYGPSDDAFADFDTYYEIGFIGEAGLKFPVTKSINGTISVRAERTLIPLSNSVHSFNTNSLIMVMGLQL